MNRTTWLVAFVFLFSCCVVAGDTGSIRCQAGESYVYLYQSPSNFQVIANLKCGQKVELLERPGNGMMRVRASDGKEGYVSNSDLTAITPTTQQPATNASLAAPPKPQVTTSQPTTQQPATPGPAPVRAGRRPLTDSELLALVAGNALSENIVRQLNSRGLAFRPTDPYQSLLQTTGADAALIVAVAKATNTSSGQGAANDRSRDPLLQHLATAGKLIRGKQYQEASQELSAALESGDGYEAGFVMGESLRQQERWLEASAVYEEVLRRAPGFLEARTKWTLVLYRGGDAVDALQQAKIVLAQDPEDAEAHKNAGLALQVLQKFDASENEYKEALRIKPDYAAVRYDLGILLYKQGKWDEAIEQYRKSLALDPNEPDWHYNLGLAYQDKGNLDSAIREYREAKRLNPKMFAARMNLGSALMQNGLYAEAVVELRELEAMAPDSAMCHDCLANALYGSWRLDEAAQEYRKAMELDPSDAAAHRGLGSVKEVQKDYDGALEEFLQAEKLDPTDAYTRRGAGRVLLDKKDASGAAEELKRAEILNPADASTHDLYGQALEMSGNQGAAIAEYKQALGLDAKNSDTRLRLAAALEKNQNWVEALDQYRQMAAGDPRPDRQALYRAAKQRLDARISAMKDSGNAAGAAEMKADMRAALANPTISQRLDEAMLAGGEASQAQRWDEAEKFYKQAVELADKLQPHDDRLVTSLMHLGGLYQGRKDATLAEATFQRYLKASEELYGAESPQMTQPLQVMAMYKLANRDFNSALDFYQRAVDINVKTFGEGTQPTAMALVGLASVYTVQKAYDKAEPYLLRSLHIEEGLVGRDGMGVSFPLASLCNLYDQWGKPDKAEPCYRQTLDVVTKQYGADTPILLNVLPKEAQALRALGRLDEAKQVEHRMEAIRATAGAQGNFDPNGPPPMGPGGTPATPQH
jgi:tetratricopeptide (TPR) repeat protein